MGVSPAEIGMRGWCAPERSKPDEEDGAGISQYSPKNGKNHRKRKKKRKKKHSRLRFPKIKV